MPMKQFFSLRDRLQLPLWLCIILLIGALVRVWLLINIPAFTAYAFWSQSLPALLLSLCLVGLTWLFAGQLADRARLSTRGKERLMVMSTLSAAAPPLYATEQGLTFWHGVSTNALLVAILWLLFCVFRLTQRWQDEISRCELLLRFLGIGLLSGLLLSLNILACATLLTGLHWMCTHPPTTHKWQRLTSATSILTPPSFTSRLHTRIFQLTSLPLLFIGYLMLVGLLNMLIPSPILANFNPHDASEQLITVLPFFCGTFFALPYMITQYQQEHTPSTPLHPAKVVLIHSLFLAFVLLYFGLQCYSYITASAIGIPPI
ncbi:hypothetical protein [Dictyobacter arantiisoli]|uniref:Uncharacterized protein n=1 Tax=Dictyobacter arantiisoli TaxID=2014874 RepID=A0A5A5TBA2_9CHLR|nr:hypothetical protein [Dictyobacter arantiisoli]GCF08712.1 hypothetical protein KDI_22760 [Dictyobacter arantiisoli]